LSYYFNIIILLNITNQISAIRFGLYGDTLTLVQKDEFQKD